MNESYRQAGEQNAAQRAKNARAGGDDGKEVEAMVAIDSGSREMCRGVGRVSPVADRRRFRVPAELFRD